MNTKQEQFVYEYIKDANATQAAIRAGYSERTAYSQGQRLLKNVEVFELLSDLQKQKKDEAILSRERRMIALSKLAIDLEEDSTVRIRAIDTLNKMDGVYTNKVEVSGEAFLSVTEKKELAKGFIKNMINR